MYVCRERKRFSPCFFPFQEADMAAAAMTVTSGRQEVVDFTSPLIIDGRSVLVKKTADVSTLTELVEKAEGGEISLLAVRGYTIELIRGSQNPLLQRLSDLVGDDNLVASPEKGIEMVSEIPIEVHAI